MNKKMFRYLCILIGAAVTLNGIALFLLANFSIGNCLTFLLGLVILLPSVFIKTTARLMRHRPFKAAGVLVIFALAFMLLSTGFLFTYGNNDTATYSEDYLLILGCGVRGEQPTEPLRARLDAALAYLERNPDCRIIVSGGQGSGENITEAEAMRRYLTAHGIDNSRIIPEGRSTSTTENFRFSDNLVDGGLSSVTAAFVTNDFHVYRASSLAGLQGLTLTHISAPTSWYNLLPCYLREFLAIGQMLLLNK